MFHPPENASNVYIYIFLYIYIHVQSFLDVLPMVLSSGLTFVKLSKGYTCLDESVEIFQTERRRFWTMPNRASQSQSEQISCFDLYRDPAGGWRDYMPCSGSAQRRRHGACGPEGPIGSWISWESFLAAAAWKSGADCLVW